MNTYTLIGSVLGAVLSEEPLCTLHFRSKLHSAFPCKGYTVHVKPWKESSGKTPGKSRSPSRSKGTWVRSGCAGAVKWLYLRLAGGWVRCTFLAALCWARARDVQRR